MTTRLLAPVWLFCFAAALMPFAALEAHSVLLAVAGLGAAVSFVILKTDFPRDAAPVSVAFFALVFGFWGVAFLSVLLSEIPYTSLIYFAFFSAFPLTLCCSILVQKKGEFFAAVAAGLFVIFAALSAVSLLQFFAMPGALVFGRVHWPFSDPNSLAGLMALGFFLGFGLMLGGHSRLHNNLGLLLAILTFGALLVTGSRGGLIGVLAGLFVLSALAMPQLRKHTRCLLIFVAAAGAIFWAVHTAAPAGSEDAAQRIEATLRGDVPALWSRPAIWEGTEEIIEAHYWTGTGIGTFFLYYPEVRLPADARSAGRMAHSDPLQFWAEMGVFSPVLFYGFIALAVILTVRALMKLPPSDDRRVHILAPFCGLWALVLHTHITFHFYMLPILMLCGVMVGFWFWQVRGAAGDRLWKVPSLKLPPQQVLKVLFIVPLLLGTYAFAMLQSSHIMVTRGEAKLLAGNIEGFGHDVNAADRMALGRNEQALLLAAKAGLAVLQSFGGIPDPGAEDLYARGLNQLARAKELNPRSAVAVYLEGEYARSAGLLGFEKKGDAQKIFRDALRLNPAFFAPRLALAQLYLRQENSNEAYAVMKDGMQWRYTTRVPAEYYELMARLALEAGDSESRDFSLRMLLKTRPEAGVNPQK